jgi:Protein of unknown function (DUF2970)
MARGGERDVERNDSGLRDAVHRKASFGQTARAVLWSFIGIRKGAGYRKDAEQLNPVHVIIMGIAAAALFVLVLILIVKWVTS